MDIVTAIKQLSPHAKQSYLDGFANAGPLFEQNGINTPLRRVNLVCQVMGETGGCTIVQESGNYSAARIVEIFGPGHSSAAIGPAEAARLAGDGPALFDRTYGLGNPHMAHMLGNTQKGDGWKFRGIGPLQSTGRGAAIRWGDKCRADFVTDPLVMMKPEYIMLPPLLEWTAGNLNQAADQDDTRRIRRVINGGYNGMADVQHWHDLLWPLLRANDNESWQVAAPSNSTAVLQQNLNALGASPKLVADGKYGPATIAAVKWFQAIAGVKVDGAAGPITVAAISVRIDGRHMAEAAQAA